MERQIVYRSNGEKSLPIDEARTWGIYARKQGEANSPIHFHDYDEWYFVLEGSGTVRVGEQETRVNPMDLVHIPAGVLHGTLEVYEPYKLLYIEGRLRGACRVGHLHQGRDASFQEL